MDNVVQSFDSNINSILEDYVRKPTIIKAIVQLLLMLYAVRLAPTPPPVVLELFKNTYFKLFIFSLILWTAQVSPSTSILIAVAFMITVNYTTTGKIWEMMEDTSMQSMPSVTAEQSAEAVQVLARAASSLSASAVSSVIPVANIAMSNTTSEDGAAAVQALATQAATPVAGTPDNVAAATQIAMNSISSATVTAAQSAQAVQVLAQAASSPLAAPTDAVMPVAQIAMANTTSEDGAAAVQALATQAVTPAAGTPDNVSAAAQIAMNSIAPIVSTEVSTSSDAVAAIQTLAAAASSPSAAPPSIVVPAANVAASIMTSDDGVAAVQALAQQAMTPAAGTPANVAAAVQTAVSSAGSSSDDVSASTPDHESQPAEVVDGGCYPLRNYDMKKVMPMKAGGYSFEDYQQFMPTKQ